MRILIADDAPATLAVMRRILMRHFPCEVSEVDNGLDALERLTGSPHSQVLLDVKMPLLNGVETLRAIRAHQRTSALPVIVMTGSTEEDVVREMVSLGVSDYVIKPVRPAIIVERVARIAGEPARPEHRCGSPRPPACCWSTETRTSRRSSGRSRVPTRASRTPRPALLRCGCASPRRSIRSRRR